MLQSGFWILFFHGKGDGMGFQKALLTLVLKIFNLFRFLMPIHENRITFISLTSDHLQDDFACIYQHLQDIGCYDLRCNLIVFKKTRKDDFKYMLNCFKQLYQINTSRLIILNDNNFVVTRFKRKHTYVLQTWHACGAIKKFGNQIKRTYPIQNYDRILSNSAYWKPVYAQAFHVQEEQVIVTGMPRVDALCDPLQVEAMRQAFFKRYPKYAHMYIILYAPTFRGNIIQGLRYDTIDFDSMLSQLPKDTCIFYKMHPLLKDISLGEKDALINANHEDLQQLLCACDCLITDYSSILFDYSLLHKKAVCYASDYEEYEKAIGFNVDYVQSMPSCICSDEASLLETLKKRCVDMERVVRFQKQFMPYTDGKNIERVIVEIKKLMKNAQ